MKYQFLTFGAVLLLNVLFSNHAKADVCRRNPLVVRAIEQQTQKNCQEINSNDLANVQEIKLNNSGIVLLGLHDFEGLTDLRTLELGHNQLSDIPPGLFNGLTKLQKLELRSNRLSFLPLGVFDNLTDLKYLSIGENGFTTLQVGVFSGLKNLEVLDIWNNQIDELKAGLFAGLTNLKILDLDCHRMTTLPKGLFDGLVSLQNLSIRSGRLKTLPVDVFAGLPRLLFLDLTSNELNELQAGVFNGLTALQKLIIGLNQLIELPAGVFDGLIALQYLDIQYNRLFRLSKNVFRGPAGVDINLFHNNINLIEDDLFGHDFYICPVRRIIEMDGNPIAKFPAEKLPKARNPYQCPFFALGDADLYLDLSFHALLSRMDTAPPTFTQIESVVPFLEKTFIRDYPKIQITAHYGFDLIPILDGTVAGLNVVRQLAIDVCSLAPSFCPVREEIHQFPLPEHLTATTELKQLLMSQGALESTIAKVAELESALLQMFSRTLNYQTLRNRLPDGTLKVHLDQLFAQTSWTFSDIAEACQKIQTELLSPHDEAWNSEHFIAFFKIKSFLIYTFKKNFWNQPIEGLSDAQTLHALVTMSQSVALLTDREAQFLRSAIDHGDDFKAIIEKSVQWQLKNLEREHFSQVNNPAYTPVLPQYPDPKEMLEPLYEKIVRTSIIAEWDRLH